MTYTINGKVTQSNTEYFDCLVNSDLVVKTYEVVFNDAPVYIQSTTVDSEGNFTDEVDTSSHAIIVRLYMVNGSIETILGESKVFCGHDKVEVEFRIDETQHGDPVFTKVVSRLANAGATTASLIIDLTQEQIEQLVCLTCVNEKTLKRMQKAYALWDSFVGMNPIAVSSSDYDTAASYASHFSSQPTSAMAAENGRRLFFALLNGKEGSNIGDVFTYSTEQFGDLIQKSIDNKEIDNTLNNSTNIDYLTGSRDALLLNAADDDRYYDAKLIHLSDNSYSDKRDVLERTLDGGGLSGIITGDDDAALEKVAQVRTLNMYLYNYLPFLEAVINDRGANLNYFDLAKEGPEEWESLMTLPIHVPDIFADAAEYANAIYASIGEAQPSARMIYAIGEAGSSIPDGSDIITELENHTGFNFREHSAAAYFTTEPGQPNTIGEEVLESMMTLQRTSRLTGDTTDLANSLTLIGLDLTSSSAIVNMGENAFLRAMDGTGTVDTEAANRIWRTARGFNEAATMMAFNYLRYERPGALMPRSLGGQLSMPGVEHPNNLPDMETLFGSFDTCNCSHCQSVYSPAAYLTDLLNWLRKDVDGNLPNTTGFDALEKKGSFHRRHDIRHLLLHCENTNTLLPYLDIVNEILSVNLLIDTPGFVGNNTEPAFTTAITPYYKQLQTTKTTEEIMTEPEHRFHDSEDLLQNYCYTWALPYNVAYDEVLSFMKVSGIEYHQMIAAFSPSNLKLDEIRWARTYLNINPQELSMFTGNINLSPTFWADYWGFSGLIPIPPTVGQVLKAAKLTVKELEEILTAYYINGSTAIQIDPVDDLCDVDSYTFSPSLTAVRAEHLLKFIRLKRKTGLSTWELDTAIATLGGGVIDNAFLQKLAASMLFSKNFGISFGNLMTMMGDNTYFKLTGTGFTDYYNNLFSNRLLTDDTRAFFAAEPYALDVSDLKNEEKQFISTVLKISIPAIEGIINYTGLTGSFTSVKLAEIHRYTSLLKIFGLNHTELEKSIEFFGDIFAASNKIKAAHSFFEALTRFRSLNVPLLEFIDIAEGTGAYTIAALEPNAKKSWESVEKVFQETIEANPDKDVTDVLVEDFYTDVLVKDLAIQFDLVEADVKDIITEYSNTWLSTFITDADGSVTPRTWANKKTAFEPIYKLLNRIVIFSEIFGIEKITIDGQQKQSLAYAIATEIDGTKDVPGSPFYWLKNDYTALTDTSLAELVWIKHATLQASKLDLPQLDLESPYVDFYLEVDSYINNPTNYTIADPSKIIGLYNKLGENSPYKDLSVYEFTEIFTRAQEIAVVDNDLVSLLDAFETIYNIAQVFNIGAADAWGWVWTAWTGGTFTAASTNYAMSEDVKRAVHSIYPAFSAWSEVIVPVQNGLRARMRDAFVGLYIGQRGFADENALYNRYLLDTQMAPCMKTSRIVQATAAVQLLVHRALLNLESTVVMDEKAKKEWEWRKNYRVWEANRKVFLYPENWIEPSLRKNKTELFKAAEDLLQQDEINDRNCEEAFAGYLTGLNDVAHLDIRAVYVEDPAANPDAGESKIYRNHEDETYHVFARNWNAPYMYYYRKFSGGVWSGWEKMDIEVDSDHLIPVMFNRKMYLFFPMFVEKVYGGDPNNKYYEIQMCYTKYDFGKWSAKKILSEKKIAQPTSFQSLNPVGDDIRRFWDHSGPNSVNLQNNFYRTWDDWFALASMDKQDFYFWGENLPDGSLLIHCRRGMNKKRLALVDDNYTDFAFDLNFKINPADERVEIVGSYEINPATETDRHYLARPNMTLPYYQQMKWGKSLQPITGNDYRLFMKIRPTQDPLPTVLLSNAAGYILTYPQQYKHNVGGQPFFFKHAKRSYFFRYRDKSMIKFLSETI